MVDIRTAYCTTYCIYMCVQSKLRIGFGIMRERREGKKGRVINSL